jgi:hypothetical protein
VPPHRGFAVGATVAGLCAGAFFLGSVGAPNVGCYQCDYPCPGAFDVGAYCLTPTTSSQSACLIDGTPVAQCVPGNCGTWTLPSGSTLSLPVAPLWATLGSRDDLHWFVDCAPPDPDAGIADGGSGFVVTSSTDASAGVAIVFDGVTAQGCICIPQTEITCQNVPHTVQNIGFQYVQAASPTIEAGVDAGSAGLPLSIAFDVGSCLASHAGCPHSDVPEASAY